MIYFMTKLVTGVSGKTAYKLSQSCKDASSTIQGGFPVQQGYPPAFQICYQKLKLKQRSRFS